jgi:hypothetical protein
MQSSPSSASLNHRHSTHVLVPVNPTTRAFLSQFYPSLEHLSSDFPSTLKNQKYIDYPIDNDKEYPTDEEEPFEKNPKNKL